MLLKIVTESTRNSWSLNCQTGLNRPKSPILFHKNISPPKLFYYGKKVKEVQILETQNPDLYSSFIEQLKTITSNLQEADIGILKFSYLY